LETPEIKILLKEAQAAVLRILPLKVTAGISAFGENFDQIREKYKEAYELTRYTFVQPGEFIHDSIFLGTLESKENFSSHYTTMILDSVRKSNQSTFEMNVEKLLSSCSSLRYEIMLKIITDIGIAIYKLWKEMGKEDKFFGLPGHVELFQEFEAMEETDEFKKWFLDIFDQVEGSMNDIKNIKVYDVVEQAMGYIQEHYNQPELSANSMADMLSITPSYFSRVFKEYSGSSFPDYINHIRLEKARELLIEKPELDMMKICSYTGYNSTTYFATAFSKKYGLSPSKYRLSKAQNKL
jgi:two-component system, response regulator YesN